MRQYMLGVYQPDGDPPASVDMDQVMKDVAAVRGRCRRPASGCSRTACTRRARATVVRVEDGEALVTDGPYIEGKEHMGGFTIIEVPDLDAALEWARKAAAATTLPIEVRPLAAES